MTIEELQYLERDSFQKEFDELVDRHEETMNALGMGLNISGNITRYHYKKQEFCLENHVVFNVCKTQEYYD